MINLYKRSGSGYEESPDGYLNMYGTKMIPFVRIAQGKRILQKGSVVDPHHVDADPDRSHRPDANPDAEGF